MATPAKSGSIAAPAKKAGTTAAAKTTQANRATNRAAVKKAPAKAAAPSTAQRTRGNGAAGKVQIHPEQRRNYIEVAAYYIAERRGFMGGHEEEDWTAAEVEIDRLLAEGKLNQPR
jgi:hypothetical protein